MQVARYLQAQYDSQWYQKESHNKRTWKINSNLNRGLQGKASKWLIEFIITNCKPRDWNIHWLPHSGDLMKITIHKLLKGSFILPEVNNETHTGLGLIQKQPQANVRVNSNSSTGHIPLDT